MSGASVEGVVGRGIVKLGHVVAAAAVDRRVLDVAGDDGAGALDPAVERVHLGPFHVEGSIVEETVSVVAAVKEDQSEGGDGELVDDPVDRHLIGRRSVEREVVRAVGAGNGHRGVVVVHQVRESEVDVVVGPGDLEEIDFPRTAGLALHAFRARAGCRSVDRVAGGVIEDQLGGPTQRVVRCLAREVAGLRRGHPVPEVSRQRLQPRHLVRRDLAEVFRDDRHAVVFHLAYWGEAPGAQVGRATKAEAGVGLPHGGVFRQDEFQRVGPVPEPLTDDPFVWAEPIAVLAHVEPRVEPRAYRKAHHVDGQVDRLSRDERALEDDPVLVVIAVGIVAVGAGSRLAVGLLVDESTQPEIFRELNTVNRAACGSQRRIGLRRVAPVVIVGKHNIVFRDEIERILDVFARNPGLDEHLLFREQRDVGVVAEIQRGDKGIPQNALQDRVRMDPVEHKGVVGIDAGRIGDLHPADR